MTALKQYERLESTALWRATPDAQRREVVLFFGDATLVIADGAARPLTHWSLAAIERINPGVRPALFAPDEDHSETLEIDDASMIDAIETVRKTIARHRPHPGRLRWLGLGFSFAAVLALMVFWLPGALRSHALGVVPTVKRAEIGATLLGHMQRLTGMSCRDPQGVIALSRLKARIYGPASSVQLVFVPDGVVETLSLPGQIIVANRRLVEDHEEPEVLAGYLLAENTVMDGIDPLEPLLKHAGFRATVTLLTTSNLPADTLRSYAETIITTPRSHADTDLLLERFAQHDIASAPYAYALDITGETSLDLIEADPVGASGAPLLNDRDWVALQGICGG